MQKKLKKIKKCGNILHNITVVTFLKVNHNST